MALGQILGSVAGPLIGGLFGRSNRNQTQTTRVDYNHIRNAASAAGFNPLTALRNGGSANATTTMPSLSSGGFIAEALSRGVNTWFNRDQTARDEEMDQINLELAREELSTLRSRSSLTAGGGAGYDVQSYTAQMAPALAQTDAAGNPVTTVVAGGQTVRPSSVFSDADTISQRWGEPGEWLAAPFIMLADAMQFGADNGGGGYPGLARRINARQYQRPVTRPSFGYGPYRNATRATGGQNGNPF